MGTNRLQRVVALLVWAAAAMLLCACGGGGENEDEAKARAIFEKAKELQMEGKSIEAMKEYDRLAEFPETQTYAEAKKMLLGQGVSIGSALSSWTLKKMFVIKNDLIQSNRDVHPDGDIRVPLKEADAWGNKMWVQYSTDERFSFIVVSSGPDGLADTDDDLTLYNRRTFRGVKRPAGDGDSMYAPDVEVTVTTTTYAPATTLPTTTLPPAPPEAKAPDTVPPPKPAGGQTPAKTGPGGENVIDLQDLLDQ